VYLLSVIFSKLLAVAKLLSWLNDVFDMYQSDWFVCSVCELGVSEFLSEYIG